MYSRYYPVFPGSRVFPVFPCIPCIPVIAGLQPALLKSNKETPKVQRYSFSGKAGKDGIREYREYREYTGTRVTLRTALFCCKAAEKPLIPLCFRRLRPNQVVLDSPDPCDPGIRLCRITGSQDPGYPTLRAPCRRRRIQGARSREAASAADRSGIGRIPWLKPWNPANSATFRTLISDIPSH